VIFLVAVKIGDPLTSGDLHIFLIVIIYVKEHFTMNILNGNTLW